MNLALHGPLTPKIRKGGKDSRLVASDPCYKREQLGNGVEVRSAAPSRLAVQKDKPAPSFPNPEIGCRLDRSEQSNCVMFSRPSVAAGRRDRASECSDDLREDKPRGIVQPGQIWLPSFYSCPASEQSRQNSNLAQRACALLDSERNVGRDGTGGYALHER